MQPIKYFGNSSLCLYLIFLFLILISFSGRQIPINIEIAVVIFSLTVIGLPHGATDLWLSRRYGLITNMSDTLVFLFGYISISVLVVVGWTLFPTFFLCMFLVLSVWHFGNHNLAYAPILLRIIDGLMIIGAPAAFSHDQVATIYENLSGPAAIALLDIQTFLFYLSATFMTVVFITDPYRKDIAVPFLDSVALVGVSILVSPLLYFTIFFNGLHAPKHLYEIRQNVQKEQITGFMISIVILTIVSIAAGALMTWWLLSCGTTFEVSIERVVFIGLASLTFPHILLVDFYGSFNRIRDYRFPYRLIFDIQ